MSKPRLSLQATIKKRPTQIFLGGLVALTFVLVFAFSYSVALTQQSLVALSKQEFTVAQQKAHTASFLPTMVSLITLRQSDTIEAWEKTLELIALIPVKKESLVKTLKGLVDSNSPVSLVETEQELSEIRERIIQINAHFEKSFFLKKNAAKEKLDTILSYLNQAETILQTITQEPHTILVLLQNTEELRASGGFMGSYARIDITQGSITNITIQDIYEPDGQFTGFVDAPPGAKEYLSGGDGLRLPDSNWHPDFPTAAKTISNYFAFGNERKIDSVVTLNVEMIEKLLNIIGEIYLPDYGVTVTADNLTALARADRNAFFAGSKQKANFLTTLFDHLKIKLRELTPSQQSEIVQLFMLSLETKDVQFFSWHEPLQTIFDKNNISGELEYNTESDFYLYLVESNVGINKANKKITRSVELNLGEQRTDLAVTFTNDDTESNLDYINYQRILLNPSVTIQKISYGEEQIEYVENGISNAKGTNFKEVGFLVPVESGITKTLTIQMTHPLSCPQEKCILQIQKQSGLPPTPYQVRYKGNTQSIILEKDVAINLEE